jgi:DNA polymerase-3 subunit alpha
VFVQGAENRGVKADTATYIFDLMEKFAGYGFNKSHSAAYALVSYQTAWLKAHYPAAFMAAVLSSDMDKTDKVVVFMEEARQMNLMVALPDVNISDYRFTVDEQGRILYGLGAIKGVGENAIENLLEERRRGGPFADLFDLCRRLDLHKVNRRVLESLIRAGACDALGANRATLMGQLPEALRLAEQNFRNDAVGQNDLFGLPDDAVMTAPRASDPGELADWDEEERLRAEKETLGLYLTGHPIDRFAEELRHFTTGTLADIAAQGERLNAAVSRYDKTAEKKAVIAGLVVGIRTRNANRGGRMAFVTLDDRTARLEIRVFPEVYAKYRPLIVNDRILVVQGALAWDDFSESLRVNAERLLDLDTARDEYAQCLVLHLDAAHFDNGLINHLAATLAPHRPGRCAVWVHYRRPEAGATIAFGQDWRIKPVEGLLRELRTLVGEERVSVLY